MPVPGLTNARRGGKQNKIQPQQCYSGIVKKKHFSRKGEDTLSEIPVGNATPSDVNTVEEEVRNMIKDIDHQTQPMNT